MPRDDGCSENLIVPFPCVDFHKTLFFAVQNRTIDILELAQVSVHFYAALVSVTFVKADVRDFRIGVSAPGHRERARPLAAEEQRILNYEARGKIGGMR